HRRQGRGAMGFSRQDHRCWPRSACRPFHDARRRKEVRALVLFFMSRFSSFRPLHRGLGMVLTGPDVRKNGPAGCRNWTKTARMFTILVVFRRNPKCAAQPVM